MLRESEMNKPHRAVEIADPNNLILIVAAVGNPGQLAFARTGGFSLCIFFNI